MNSFIFILILTNLTAVQGRVSYDSQTRYYDTQRSSRRATALLRHEGATSFADKVDTSSTTDLEFMTNINDELKAVDNELVNIQKVAKEKHTDLDHKTDHIKYRSTPTSIRSFLPITKEKISLIKYAMRQNRLIWYMDEDPENFPVPDHIRVYEFHNKVDRMFLEEYNDDHCMVTWMSTKNNRDFMQSFNIQLKNIETYRGVCSVHRGMWQAYSGSGLGDSEDFVPILTEFIEQCKTDEKQLIFNGFSQGAGAATLAHLIWADYEPITINFAGPPIFQREGGCGIIPGEDIWRIINSEVTNGVFFGESIVYDAIASTNSLIDLHHVGGYIILPPGDSNGNMIPEQNSVAYSDPNHPEMKLGAFAPYYIDAIDDVQLLGSAHLSDTYRNKMDALDSSLGDGEKLDIKGFIDGTVCRVDKECRSGRCARDSNLDNRCQAKLSSRAYCSKHSDCQSGNCNWRYRCT